VVPPIYALVEAVSRLVKFEPEMTGSNWLVYNHHTNPRLQEGPQCGLVALTTGVNCLLATEPELFSVAEVQSRAVELEFTRQGEMFSADNMAKLGQEFGVNTRVESVRKLSDTSWLSDMLGCGNLIMVPYDCGPGHGPCLAGGKKAHWCLVTGLIVQSTDSQDIDESIRIMPGFYGTRRVISGGGGLVKVIARQSKSLVLGCWNVDELVSSCENLTTLGDKRDDENYQIPEGGIEAGLCGKIVLMCNR